MDKDKYFQGRPAYFNIFQLGSNPISIQFRGKAEQLVQKGQTQMLSDGDHFSLLPGVATLRFRVHIDSSNTSNPKPSSVGTTTAANKRKRETATDKQGDDGNKN